MCDGRGDLLTELRCSAARQGERARAALAGVALAAAAVLGGCNGTFRTGTPRTAQVSFVEQRLVSAPFDSEVLPYGDAWSPTGRCAVLAVRVGGRVRVLVNQAFGPAVDQVPTETISLFPWVVFDRAGERAAYLVNVGGKTHVVDFDGEMSAAYDEVTAFGVGLRGTLGWVGRLDGRVCAVFDGDEDDLFDEVPLQALFDLEGRPAYVARGRDGWYYVHDGRRYGPFERCWRGTSYAAEASRGCVVREGGTSRFLDDDGTPGEPFDQVLLVDDQGGHVGRLGARWFEVRAGRRTPVPEVPVQVRLAADDQHGLRKLADGRLVTLVPASGATPASDLLLHALLPDGRPVLTVAAEGKMWEGGQKRLLVGEVWSAPFDVVNVITDGATWAARARGPGGWFLCATDGARGPFQEVAVLRLRPDGAAYVALKQDGRWSYEGGPPLAADAHALDAYPYPHLGAPVGAGNGRVAAGVVAKRPDRPDRLYVVVFDGASASVQERAPGEFVQLTHLRVLPTGATLAGVVDYPNSHRRLGSEAWVAAERSGRAYERVRRVWAGEREHGPCDNVSEVVQFDEAGARAAFGARVGRELWWKVVDLR
ncbi:MAG: hypothetical protein M9894_13100 [Planctomycetes bacterium]|nr:hypothetical protein [Planctomycetota bacterium]